MYDAENEKRNYRSFLTFVACMVPFAEQTTIKEDTYESDIHLTVRVCTTKRLFSEQVFIKISYCVFKCMMLKMKKETIEVS